MVVCADIHLQQPANTIPVPIPNHHYFPQSIPPMNLIKGFNNLVQQNSKADEESNNNNLGKVIQIGTTPVRIIKKIGEGGYSFVFLVQNTATDTKYALKRCICGDSESIQNTEEEIKIMKILTQLNHPNLMRYVSHSVKPGNQSGTKEYYILTEFCSNGSLIGEIQSHLDRGILYPELNMAIVLEQVFRGLDAMHCLPTPVAHRDIKLENILIDASNVYKLCDFGSTSTDNRVFETSAEMQKQELIIQKKSTEMYRSPELCDLYRAKNNNWPISPKVDIWAVGNILYTLAYHTHPFEDGGYMAILSGRIIWPNTQPGSKFAKSYSPWVNYIISKCFTMNPNKRPSAKEMLGLIGSWQFYLKNRGQFNNTQLQQEISTWVPRIITDGNQHITTQNQPAQPSRSGPGAGGAGAGAVTPSKPGKPKMDLQAELARLEKEQWEKVAQEEKAGLGGKGPGNNGSSNPNSSTPIRHMQHQHSNSISSQSQMMRPGPQNTPVTARGPIRGQGQGQGAQLNPNSILRPLQGPTLTTSLSAQQLPGSSLQFQQGTPLRPNRPGSKTEAWEPDFDSAFDSVDFGEAPTPLMTPAADQSVNTTSPNPNPNTRLVQVAEQCSVQTVGASRQGSIFDDFPDSAFPTESSVSTSQFQPQSLSAQPSATTSQSQSRGVIFNNNHQATQTLNNNNNNNILLPNDLTPQTSQAQSSHSNANGGPSATPSRGLRHTHSQSTTLGLQRPSQQQQPPPPPPSGHRQPSSGAGGADDWGDFSVAFDTFLDDSPQSNPPLRSSSSLHQASTPSQTSSNTPLNKPRDIFDAVDFGNFGTPTQSLPPTPQQQQQQFTPQMTPQQSLMANSSHQSHQSHQSHHSHHSHSFSQGPSSNIQKQPSADPFAHLTTSQYNQNQHYGQAHFNPYLTASQPHQLYQQQPPPKKQNDQPDFFSGQF